MATRDILIVHGYSQTGLTWITSLNWHTVREVRWCHACAATVSEQNPGTLLEDSAGRSTTGEINGKCAATGIEAPAYFRS